MSRWLVSTSAFMPFTAKEDNFISWCGLELQHLCRSKRFASSKLSHDHELTIKGSNENSHCSNIMYICTLVICKLPPEFLKLKMPCKSPSGWWQALPLATTTGFAGCGLASGAKTVSTVIWSNSLPDGQLSALPFSQPTIYTISLQISWYNYTFKTHWCPIIP